MSVIIASYQWPEALRVSLESALSQTIDDLEVLVVEDGPDCASRQVVSEAADRRASWTFLRTSGGSQSGPNAYGWRLARAPIVAYLGHDDVWHPEHLERLLEVLTPGSDVAHAVTLYLGADGDKRIEVAGARRWDPTMFVPPSSIAHWRDSARIGQWRSPEASSAPVDYAFLLACHERGARFVSDGAPSVFKHPAGWRLDSYKTRDAGPQLRIRDLVASDPLLGQRLVERALACGVRDTLPAPMPAPPGVIADHNRRLKGLPARFAPPLTHWRAGEYLPFPGWHPAERDAAGAFAWTGPSERAIVRLDAPRTRELGVRIVVRHVALAEQLDGLRVDVDGTTVALSREARAGVRGVLTGWLGRGPSDETVEVALTAAVVDPRTLDPGSPDTRLLGLAVSEIELLSRA